jgi:hypothetical protein
MSIGDDKDDVLSETLKAVYGPALRAQLQHDLVIMQALTPRISEAQRLIQLEERKEYAAGIKARHQANLDSADELGVKVLELHGPDLNYGHAYCAVCVDDGLQLDYPCDTYELVENHFKSKGEVNVEEG